jgi:CRISPR-associated protein Csb2
MSNSLCITATLVSALYHGQEWPPSPARLFQALLAGAKAGVNRFRCAQADADLQLIQRLPSPEIVAPEHRRLPAYRLAVPNNDLDRAAREWVKGSDFNLSKLKTFKTVQPRALGGSSGDARVYYIWALKGNISLESIRDLTHCLHTFGWGIDMAYADACLLDEQQRRELISRPGFFHYRPSNHGKALPIPVPGYLEDLMQAYEAYCNRISKDGVNPDTRATQYGMERYKPVGSSTDVSIARFELRQLENDRASYSVPWSLGPVRVAPWLRNAAHRALRRVNSRSEAEINSYVLGHGEGYGKHVSFVAVPSIGSHADGSVRRAMIVEPEGEDRGIAADMQTELHDEKLYRLIESNGNGRPAVPVCRILESDWLDGVWQRYLPREPKPEWGSVTPVVLHGHNSEHGKFSLKKTEQLLYQAFEKSGYSRQTIAELAFQPAPFWVGTEGALAMRVPEHLKKWPRYHVAVRFHQPVSGPLLVGIGRHYGVGLFAAVD